MLCQGNVSTYEHIWNDEQIRILSFVYISPFSILASVWNLWVIYKVVVTKHFQTVSNILFANLCATELVASSFGTVSLLCILLSNYESYITILVGSYVLTFCLTSCLMSMFIFAVDTWMKLSHPVKYVEKISLAKVMGCLAMLWSVSTIVSTFMLGRFYQVTETIRNSGWPTPPRHTGHALCLFVRQFVVFINVFIVPIALTVFVLGIYTVYTTRKHMNAVIPFLVQPALPRVDGSAPRIDGGQADRLGHQPPHRQVEDPETNACRKNIRYAVLFLTFGLVWIPLSVVNIIMSYDDNKISTERAFLINIFSFAVAYTWVFITTTITLLNCKNYQTVLKNDLRCLRDKLTRHCM